MGECEVLTQVGLSLLVLLTSDRRVTAIRLSAWRLAEQTNVFRICFYLQMKINAGRCEFSAAPASAIPDNERDPITGVGMIHTHR